MPQMYAGIELVPIMPKDGGGRGDVETGEGSVVQWPIDLQIVVKSKLKADQAYGGQDQGAQTTSQ